jgi:aminopeptidase 2
MNAFYPEWKVTESFVSEDLQSALSLDGLRSSHAIEVMVNRAEEINEIFDSISYSKGSCVLHMISAYLGEDVFIEGVRRYLKKHAYGNTETGDLWESLSEASGKDVGAVMDIWTKNVGYPVVSVKEGESSIQLEQHRFLSTGDVASDEDNILYPIFLNLKTKSGIDDTLSLKARQQSFPLKDLDFFKLNANSTGFYRTQYSSERLQKLGNASALLSVQDRVGLVADASALATSGYQKTSSCLGLFQALKANETEYLVWDQILSRLAAIKMAWIEDDEVVARLQDFQRDISSDLAHKLGWEFTDQDGHIEQQFKAMMFSSAGMAGDETILRAAKGMFNKFLEGEKSAIHPNLRNSVFAINLKYGGDREVYSLPPFSRVF